MQKLENKIAKLKQELAQVQAELEKVKEAKYNPNWEPKCGEYYFFLRDGGIERVTNKDDIFDFRVYMGDLLFPTPQSARKYSEWYKAFINLVRLIAEVNEMYIEDAFNYSFEVTNDGKIDSLASCVVLPMLRVKSKTGAQKLIEYHSDLIRKVWTMPW